MRGPISQLTVAGYRSKSNFQQFASIVTTYEMIAHAILAYYSMRHAIRQGGRLRPKSPNKLRHVGAYVTEEVYTELKKAAAEQDRSVSYLIVSLIKKSLFSEARGKSGMVSDFVPGKKSSAVSSK